MESCYQLTETLLQLQAIQIERHYGVIHYSITAGKPGDVNAEPLSKLFTISHDDAQ